MASKRHVRKKQCGNKKRHADHNAAWAHLRKLYDSGKVESHSMQVYKCKWCKKYHIGHFDPSKKLL